MIFYGQSCKSVCITGVVTETLIFRGPVSLVVTPWAAKQRFLGFIPSDDWNTLREHKIFSYSMFANFSNIKTKHKSLQWTFGWSLKSEKNVCFWQGGAYLDSSFINHIHFTSWLSWFLCLVGTWLWKSLTFSSIIWHFYTEVKDKVINLFSLTSTLFYI